MEKAKRTGPRVFERACVEFIDITVNQNTLTITGRVDEKLDKGEFPNPCSPPRVQSNLP